MIISKETFQRIYKENAVECTCVVLILTNDCNASCRACIGQHVFKSALCKDLCYAYEPKCVRCCDHTASDEKFYSELREILKTINSPIVDIIISGGEPTLSPRLLPVLKIIDQYHYQYKTLEMETNGAALGKSEIAEELIKHNVRMHLSRYAISDEANDEEFRYKFNRVTSKDIAQFAKSYGELLGISTVLLKKHIASAQDLLRFIKYYRQLGVRQFSFVEVMADTSLRESNKSLLAYYEEQIVPIVELSAQLEVLGCKKILENANDAFRIIVHEHEDQRFVMTSSNLSVQYKQVTENAFSRFLIMPSGDIGVNGIEVR